MIKEPLLRPQPTRFRLLLCVRKIKYFLKSLLFLVYSKAPIATPNSSSHSVTVKIEWGHSRWMLSPVSGPQWALRGEEFTLSLFIWNIYIVLAQDARAKYHRLGTLHKWNLFLIVLEAGSPGSRCWPIWFLEGPLPGLQTATFSLCLHMTARKGKLWSLFFL